MSINFLDQRNPTAAEIDAAVATANRQAAAGRMVLDRRRDKQDNLRKAVAMANLMAFRLDEIASEIEDKGHSSVNTQELRRLLAGWEVLLVDIRAESQ